MAQVRTGLFGCVVVLGFNWFFMERLFLCFNLDLDRLLMAGVVKVRLS